MIGERPPGPRGNYAHGTAMGCFDLWVCPDFRNARKRLADIEQLIVPSDDGPPGLVGMRSRRQSLGASPGGANFGFADGSVRFCGTAKPASFGLSARAGGEIVNADY